MILSFCTLEHTGTTRWHPLLAWSPDIIIRDSKHEIHGDDTGISHFTVKFEKITMGSIAQGDWRGGSVGKVLARQV